jgi:hypothetical protein
MNSKTSLISALVLAAVIPLSAAGKKKEQPQRAMLENMEAVPCGATEKGLTGLGSVWASAGITHVNSNEKMCPQYMLRTDEMEYHIRPMDLKHPVVLPVGKEVQIRIDKDHMILKSPDGKTETYQVVGEKQGTSGADAQNLPSSNPAKP